MEEDGKDPAARAFEDLRAELALMRRAVDRLLSEHAGQSPAPDYSETLGVISHNLSGTAQRVDALVSSPALSLTPEELGRQIVAAAYDARREDHRLFLAAQQGMLEVGTTLGRQLNSHTMADEQRRRLWRTGLVALAVGALLWAVLAGPLARSMPGSWLWPEWMAARTLRMPMWEGGQRLMRAGNDQAYAGVLAGNRLVTANRDALATCRRQAAKSKKAVRCTVQVKAEGLTRD